MSTRSESGIGLFQAAYAALGGVVEREVDDGRRDEWYEEAVRDELLAGPVEAFGYEDVTGLPWIEIDFAEDVERAEKEILPNLQEVEQ